MTGIARKPNIRRMAEVALFAAITAVLAQIALPLPSGVPITLQTFAVALTGCYLGWRYGLTSVIVYIALGAVGLPVFASFRGGIAVIAGATGGFIMGFLPMAALCGLGASLRGRVTGIALALSGMLSCHVCGVVWYSAVTSTGLLPAAALVSLPFLIKDGLSVAAAFYIARIIAFAAAKAKGRQSYDIRSNGG